jgi:hypothetical protein
MPENYHITSPKPTLCANENCPTPIGGSGTLAAKFVAMPETSGYIKIVASIKS